MINCSLKSGIFAALMVITVSMFGTTAMAGTARLESSRDFPPLFDTIEYRSESFSALPQWQRVLGEIGEEAAIYEGCAETSEPCESPALLAWQAMINGQVDQPIADQLHAVNRFANRWTARTDQVNYQQADYWASPLTFLSQSGDCEDFAIIKYVSLRKLGFAPEQLRLVVVRDVLRDRPHAVLAVHAGDDIFIMDNLFNAVLPQHMVSQYLPYYSVNENARYSHIPANGVMLASVPWDVAPSMIGDISMKQ